MSAEAVGRRLERLRELFVPEDEASVRQRFEQAIEQPDFDRAVAQRLRELRALCELTEVLHRAREG